MAIEDEGMNYEIQIDTSHQKKKIQIHTLFRFFFFRMILFLVYKLTFSYIRSNLLCLKPGSCISTL